MDDGAGFSHPRRVHQLLAQDAPFARALERALEKFKPPRDLELPPRHLDIFRDEKDFTGTDYKNAIRSHLKQSRKLIVVCSQAARAARTLMRKSDCSLMPLVRLTSFPFCCPVFPTTRRSQGRKRNWRFLRRFATSWKCR